MAPEEEPTVPCDSFDPADYEESEEDEIARTGDLLCCCGATLSQHQV